MEPGDELSDGRARAIGPNVRAAVAAGAVTAAFCAGVFALPEHSFPVHVFADVGWTLASGVAAVRCLVVARKLPRPGHRRAFTYFGLGCLSWFVGITIWDFDELVRGVYTPFPSIADFFFLALVPLYLAGFATFGSDKPSVPLGLRRAGDLIVILATMSAVCSLVYGNLPDATHSRVYTFMALAYPVVHLSGLLFALLSAWYRRFAPHELSVLGTMLASLLAFSGVNVLYGHALLTHTYEAGRALDPFWFGGFVLVALAASMAERVEPRSNEPALRPSSLLDDLVTPACVAIVCSVVAAFRDSIRHEHVLPIAISGLAFCVGAALRGIATHRLERELRETIRARERDFVAAQRMEAVATLAGGLAHDFNNLLTGILAGASMLRLKGNLGPSAMPYAEMVEQSAIRAAELTKRLLTLARRREIRQTSTRPGELLAHVTALLRSALPETITIHVDGGPEPLSIRADAGLLEQALLNLGINAGHAMPDGGELRFRVEAIDLDPRLSGPAVVFHVVDTGVGIAPAIRDRIFDPFFTTRDEREGSGLGLAMVRAAAEDHGGYVDFESEPDAGAHFRVVIPRVDANRSPHPAANSDEDFPMGHETILVVDDRSAPLLAAKSVLETAGYRVIPADGVRAALASLDADPAIDLVLTDAVMPDGGARELRASLVARGVHVPVVVMSGHGSLADVGPGEVVRIEKPFLPSALARTVRATLDARSATRP